MTDTINNPKHYNSRGIICPCRRQVEESELILKALQSSFTESQRTFICHQIDDWHLIWKDSIANHKDKTNNLGYAKETLKIMICGE